MTNQNQAIAKKDETAVEFIPYGAESTLKLTVSIIQNLIAVPTRSGKTCSPKDAMKFLMLCRAKRLDPFSGDAFLIGYDGKDGVATFSLITAHQAYLKRAELHPEFDGMRSGLIIQDGEEIKDVESDFHTDEQTVLGGWAVVQFKTRKIPITRRVRLKRFQKSYGVWQEDPAGMIVKCAEADALRSAFPTMLGGLYMREEIDITKPQHGEAYDIPASRFVEVQSAPAQPANGNQSQDDSNPELNPVRGAGASQPGKTSAGADLIQYLNDNGVIFGEFVRWADATGNIKDATSLSSADEINEADGKRLFRVRISILKAINETKQTKELIP